MLFSKSWIRRALTEKSTYSFCMIANPDGGSGAYTCEEGIPEHEIKSDLFPRKKVNRVEPRVSSRPYVVVGIGAGVFYVESL